MNTNSKQSTDKTCSGAVSRIMGVLFGLFAFIWLPTPEVDAASRIFGVIRDANTNNPLPGVTITVNDVFSTVSKGPPDAGEYSIDYSGCNYFLRARLDGYEPFEDGALFFACPEEFEWPPDIELTSVIPPSSSLGLNSPPDGEQTNPVTVFRWTQSDNSAVSSYRLIIDTDENMEDPVLDLPKPGEKRIIAPQVAVRLGPDSDFLLVAGQENPFFWRVIALDESGNPVEQSQEIFSSYWESDAKGFTVISGVVKSDLNQAALVGAQVAVSGDHANTLNSNSIAVAEFNGEYLIIALTRDNAFEQIPFPIKITSTAEGFQTTEINLEENEVKDGVITRNLPMKPIDSDEDGIPDVVENASPCLDANNADTDDDGIRDGDEDTNKDGDRDPGETDPCAADNDPRQPESKASPWIPLLLMGD